MSDIRGEQHASFQRDLGQCVAERRWADYRDVVLIYADWLDEQGADRSALCLREDIARGRTRALAEQLRSGVIFGYPPSLGGNTTLVLRQNPGGGGRWIASERDGSGQQHWAGVTLADAVIAAVQAQARQYRLQIIQWAQTWGCAGKFRAEQKDS